MQREVNKSLLGNKAIREHGRILEVKNIIALEGVPQHLGSKLGKRKTTGDPENRSLSPGEQSREILGKQLSSLPKEQPVQKRPGG